jgi:hypothetical protein
MRITFGKANGYPWGAFSAYQVLVMDKHVLDDYLKDEKSQLKVN